MRFVARQMEKFAAFGCIVFAVTALFAGTAFAGSLAVHPTLLGELNKTLQVYEGLHEALYLQQDEQTEIRIRDLIRQIERTRSYLAFAKPHERGHLRLILDAAHSRLERAQTAFGDERRERLEDAVNDLVNVARIYRVDRGYGIFFCARDRKSWVQRGWRARNPFEAGALRDCGFRVKE